MGQGARILLVDDDPEARGLARALLVGAGHEVEVADDGRDGLQKALKSQPDLVVTDVMMPMVDGWAFARSLRLHPSLSLVPIIFLTALDSADDALQGFAIGADDYLPKSTALHDLARTVANVLSRRQKLQEFVDRRLQPRAAFSGEVEKLGIPAVLFLLESVAKTGTLRVFAPERGEAVVFVREGAVISAEMVHSDALRDAHLVYHLATWTRGRFSFLDGPVVGDDVVAQSTTELLLEAARRQDEASTGSRPADA